ncbi:MAG: lipopolysaccharide kinase InaA family protein, partial [Planctomycetota bacterium]
HDEAIRLPDLYVWHIFMEEGKVPGEWEFAFIDLHRMSQGVHNRNQKIGDLGRLFWSMSDKYFDHRVKDLFVQAYMAGDPTDSKGALVRTIQRRENILARRRRLKAY